MHGERVERQLAAILAADIVGYSRLMGADEEGTHAALKAIRRELGDPMIAEHRGRIVKTTGDGMLVAFSSVVDAVRCALELQRGMSGRNAGLAAENRIDFRIGINVGDVIIDGDDIYGDGVNIAARLEAIASPGGVCVSARVHEDVVGRIAANFHDMGMRRLKNIRRPVQVYSIGEDIGAAAPWRNARPNLRHAFGAMLRSMTRRRGRLDPAVAPGVVEPGAPPPSLPSAKPAILVLPFRNATGDPAQEYFTDAVTADLTIDLSRIRDIAVISAASALTYKDWPADPRQSARDLGVRYFVLGSIARLGDSVRTNIQLIVAATGEQLWADRFEHEFVDLAQLENTITGRIAASLNVQLLSAEGRRAESSPRPDALDLRLRATAKFFSSVTPEHTASVRETLRQSIELDPSSAEAWARLAEVTVSDHLNRWNDTGEEQVGDAEAAARTALSIDPSNALAHVASGLIHRVHGEHHSALGSFNRAIELDPNFAFAYAHKGSELTQIGRPEETPPLVEQALRLSPHDPSIGIFHWIAGRAHFYAGAYEAAIVPLQRSVRARPNLWYNRLYLVSAYALLGRQEDAAGALAEFNRRFTQPRYTLAIVIAHEDANPNTHPVAVAARDKFHEGLLLAGMAED